MTSLATRQKSQDNEYYIPIGSLENLIYAKGVDGALTPAAWAIAGSPYLSYINTSGAGLLKDQGRTYISSGRTFRKIQLVIPHVATFGVAGAANTIPNQDYLTGYIEIGFDAQSGGVPTPVAKWGR
jgi:hypothetical protein